VYDIEVDRINKPYLPLASGEFSLPTAHRVVALTAAAATGLAIWSQSAPLIATVVGSWVSLLSS
jgi:homogentisate phytyltransferase / homogentisate geranylgeranyltransferase